MSFLVIPAPPPEVPPLDPRPSGASMVAPVRGAGTAAENVSDWAEAGGMPPGWEGAAAASATHAMTQFAGTAGAAVAVLTRVSTALEVFFDTVSTLQQRRHDLVEEHASLSSRQHDLAADGASYLPVELPELQRRATALENAIDAFVDRVTAWSEELTRAEDALIAALQGSDTAAEARSYAASRSDQVDDMVSQLVAAGTLPPRAANMNAEELRAWLIKHPETAAALMKRGSTLTGVLGSELARLVAPGVVAPGEGAALHEQRRADARALFESLSSEDAALLAMLNPGLVGKLDGVPFENRADANTVAIVDALARERTHLEDLRSQHDENQHDGDWFGRNNDDLEGPMTTAAGRIELFESLLRGDRQILYFDPAGDVSIAELHGEISDRTRNVGVMVPGTGSDGLNYDGLVQRSESFVNERPDGDLAVVTWMGGDLPDSVPKDAPFASYSYDLGPKLANFSHDVRMEIDHSDAGDQKVATTYVGHSYGGAVVGMSEAYGLDADRVLHVESAGVGHNIFTPGDLPDSQADVDRYSMTAPGDPIAATQGQQKTTDVLLPAQNVGPAAGMPHPGALSHGADPDTFGDTVRLHTGNDENGEIIRGLPAHGGVFAQRSDSFYAALGVMTGDEVEAYREPVYTTQYGPYGTSTSPQTGWGPGQTVDVP